LELVEDPKEELLPNLEIQLQFFMAKISSAEEESFHSAEFWLNKGQTIIKKL
jgi:hypothetical protein